jgi:hypothetical protein
MPILGVIASSRLSTTSGWITLGTQVITSNTTLITFNSIPQTAKHLHYRGIARASGTGNRTSICLRINGNTTGGDYAWSGFNFGGTTSNVAQVTDMLFAGINSVPQSDAPGGTSGAFFGDINDYTATKKKSVTQITGGIQNTSDNRAGILTGVLNSTAPITSLSFNLNGFDFLPGSRISLYGTEG